MWKYVSIVCVVLSTHLPKDFEQKWGKKPRLSLLFHCEDKDFKGSRQTLVRTLSDTTLYRLYQLCPYGQLEWHYGFVFKIAVGWVLKDQTEPNRVASVMHMKYVPVDSEYVRRHAKQGKICDAQGVGPSAPH